MARHDECGDERTAEGEVAVARLATDAGDLPHAAAHLAAATATDPALPEVHEALAGFSARAGGPARALEHFPVAGETSPGVTACHAHLRAAAGDRDTAVETLAAVMAAEPSLPWAEAAWLLREDLPDLISPDAVARAAARATTTLGEPLPEAVRTALLPFDRFVTAVLDRHPDHAHLLAVASALPRLLGATDRAVERARRAHRIEPGRVQALMLGRALRAAGEADEALAVWEATLDDGPFDGRLAGEVAELYAATGRPEGGLRRVEAALRHEPDHPTTAPLLHGLRHRIDGGTDHLLALADHLRTHPDHALADELLARACHRTPWLGIVPQVVEASIDVLHQLLAEPNDALAEGFTIKMSEPEPPSALLALRLAFPRGSASYRELREPDPRLTVRPVGVRIWRYDGLDPLPAVAAPSPESAELVRRTADIHWAHPPAAYDRAVRLAGVPLDDLLGVLAHPPAPREDELGRALLAHQPELWVRAVQVFACLGIAHHRTDQPWSRSDRRRVLLDLLLGSEDWVVEAAGFALVAVGWTHPATRQDIGQRLRTRLNAVASAYEQRDVTVLTSVCTLVLACPWLDEQSRALAQDLIDRRRSNVEAYAAEDAAPPAPQLPPAAPTPSRPRGLRGLFGRGR
ncbi:hypothetical protein [Streptomyces sp. NRRL B-24484]|uniref:hypothetical protein n=1 Tax=Streptomyces sp. NRRL B-24484 TaxID=1463833 RepID=UPI000694C86F|nr:hypothetical protein [Streptomyces sp. NRRL B-24484]